MSGLAHTDEELQEVMKDGKLQREKIDAKVEKLLEAAQKGDINTLHQVLKDNTTDKEFIDQVDANKRTALHFAAHGNHLPLIEMLLQNGANVNSTDWEDWTPLMHALRANSRESAKFLVDVPGVDINTKSKKGITPLHAAVMSDNKDMIKYLVEKEIDILPDQQCESGSALHFACTAADIEIASFLVQHEPRLVNSKDENEMTPLHLACAYNNEGVAIFLINNGSDVNSVAADGATPLHIAADCGNKNIVESLISHGAVQKLDAAGYTPIMAAFKNKTKEIEEMLSKVKIDVQSPPQSDKTPGKLKISPEQLKDNGNKAFSDKDYEMALHWYSLAIDVDSITCEMYHRLSTIAHVLYSNRSTAHYHLKQFHEALEDANLAIQISPDWPKGYLRKGSALAALGDSKEAETVFAKMNELEKERK